MSKLRVSNLCKTYIVNKRQNNILRNINMELEQGEMTAVMGASGSGKTTFLYTVSGMDEATAGKVDFFGRDLTSLKGKDLSDVRLKEMGFVFQQMYMLKNLSVLDNIIMPAYQAAGGNKSKRKEINDRAKVLMNKLGISDIGQNDITEVSGGQLQRACICRSMINNPKIIFADEPTGALNKQNSIEVMNELNRINSEYETSILLVTHDMKVASRCERVLYIEDGDIKDEIALGKWDASQDNRSRERKLDAWLVKMGW
ncbi:MAG: ABC transporter ATP-binding protein [Eubacteriales bacterium]|nr:ABC transporter ATP-binding protein [Eubacteriales bacterium]